MNKNKKTIKELINEPITDLQIKCWEELFKNFNPLMQHRDAEYEIERIKNEFKNKVG
jgi:hypothetical protein